MAAGQRATAPRGDARFHVVAYDFGVKRNILRMLAERGCSVTVLPAQAQRARRARAEAGRRVPVQRAGRPGALRLRDRGDSRTARAQALPLFGICLGHQFMGLAVGREDGEDEVRPSRREPSGEGPRHRAGRDHQPEPRLRGRCERRCRRMCRPTHVSLFDGTLQGLALTDRPAFCFQGHPEASPGPHDIGYLFDRFVKLMEERSAPNAQANRHQEHPDHRRRPDRHRAGLRVRLLRRAGLQGAARRGLPGHPGELEPGDDHDRPGDGRRDLHRADHLADRGEDHREGAARRAAADDGRADRAELRAGSGASTACWRSTASS